MEFEKCYVFRSEDTRPTKRQRTEPQGLQVSWKLRKRAYAQAWQSVQKRIDAKFEKINANTVSDVSSYLTEVVNEPNATRIPAALILTGPNAILHSIISKHTSNGDGKATRCTFVSLASSSGSNLKGLLKTINQQATSQTDDDIDNDENLVSSRKGTKLLNYDLQILHDYAQERQIQQVVIAFEDTEAFDGDLLSELLELLHSWLNRIPFVCIFSIATSVDFLQRRLSNAAVISLNGKLFDAALSVEEVEQVFDAVTAPENTVWIGSNLMSMLLERQSDFLQSIDTFVWSVQYAYMACYYANALSLFLDPEIAFDGIPSDHFEALRHTNSFRNLAQSLVDEGDTGKAETLLQSDEALFSQVTESIFRGRDAMAGITAVIELIRSIQQLLPNTPTSSKPNLYNQAMSGSLLESPLLRSLMLSIRKAPADAALRILQSIHAADVSDDLTTSISTLSTELQALISAQPDASHPLRSADAVSNATLRTTVIAQKVSLSKQTAALSGPDAAYTALLRRCTDQLDTYFHEHLRDPRSLAFHEIFVYDLRSPAREVAMPRPQHAVERALAAPHDYLDCDCCAPPTTTTTTTTTTLPISGDQMGEREDAGDGLAGTQPGTAVLYQLYLESGPLINASDLWSAFHAVMTGDADADTDADAGADETRVMAMFQRGLAELRYLGFVKNTRKRVDHVAKVAWRGL